MKENNEKHKDLVLIFEVFASVVVITLFLVWLVTVFEKYGVHVAGTREMWIGLIGSLLGGVYTLIGVYATINNQRKDDRERQRLEKMPLLNINVMSGKATVTRILTWTFSLSGSKIYSSILPKDIHTTYPIVGIKLSNANPAFGVYIESCITTKHTADIQKDKQFLSLEKYRLINNEELKIMFCIDDYKAYKSKNIWGILRVAYFDLYGNEYYQDLPFKYFNRTSDEYKLEIFNLKPPVLVDKNTPTLFETMKTEYKYLLENDKSET